MYLKKHTRNEFYAKPLRHCSYYAIIDGYDKSVASLETSYNEAMKRVDELNQMRNKRFFGLSQQSNNNK